MKKTSYRIILTTLLLMPVLSWSNEYRITMTASESLELPEPPEPKYPRIESFTTSGTGDNIAENSDIVEDNVFKLSYDNTGRGKGSNTGNASVSFDGRASISKIKISGFCDKNAPGGSARYSGKERHTISSPNATFRQSYTRHASGYTSSYSSRSFTYEGEPQSKSGIYPITSSDGKLIRLNTTFDFSSTPLIIKDGERLSIYLYNRYYVNSTGTGRGCHKTFEFTYNENW